MAAQFFPVPIKHLIAYHKVPIMSNFITQKLQRFIKDESGPTAVEYAVMIALIIIVCIASVTFVGGETNALFQTSGNEIQQINANNSN